MPKNSPILARFENEPTLVAPENVSWFQSCVEQAEEHMGEINGHVEKMESGFWPHPDDYMTRYRPYVVRDGILQIPVQGVLLNRLSITASWATGYPYIWEAYKRGMDDPDVRGIALVIDSPGGAVAGNFELVDKMYERRDEKPVRAFASDRAYSAAYSIASVASNGIVVSRSGGVGSVGVVTTHMDQSEALKQAGVKITFIYKGDRKIDGNSANPLPPKVKERMQDRINTIYDEFVALVARNRGMDERLVRATEAATFTAEDSLSEGLADEIGALDDAVAAFAAEVSYREGDDTMSQAKDTPAVDQAALDAAVEKARTEALEEGRAEGRTEGAQAQRERISAILNSDEAKDRQKAAISAALDTDMTAEQATKFIGNLSAETPKAEEPKAEEPSNGAGAGPDAFKKAMENSENPGMSAGEGNDDDAEVSDVELARTMGIHGLRPAQ